MQQAPKIETRLDYRKTLALIAPSTLGPGAEVWLSETGLQRLLQFIEQVAALKVKFEILSAIESEGKIDFRYRAVGEDADEVARLAETFRRDVC
ncbi:hypothetical protein RHAB21_00817 [Pseudorhizobium halotolerans]|uniref:Uncharacterized protein n=1 Tax=Pseudorhizobium halotolerans TaxID=1233081 RepID=A0ABM8PZ66_9HYPH|nr:hypothetical protein [Pseudorhizobium halotolerans]CAD7055899.1 hypothetical protein RHAB21_00817 [Pseudorhizobium halotolerans]